MPVVRETNRSRRLRAAHENDRYEFELHVTQTGNSEAVALLAVQSYMPPEMGELDNREIELEQLHADIWLAHVTYTRKRDDSNERPPADIPLVSFDTGGHVEHVTQAIATQKYDVPNAGTAPDYGDAIHVVNGQVQGVDIPAPALRVQYRFSAPASRITTSYVQKLAELTGSINDAPFKEWKAQELLFLAAHGDRRDSHWYDLTFHFEARKSQTNLQIAGVNINKKGHDYVWVAYETKVDPGSNLEVESPVGVYVQQIYPAKDFSELNIP